MSSKYYSGIGSRITPEKVCDQMTVLAQYFDKLGYTLRSGNAEGADQAFAKGSTNAQIWLPYKEFNQEFQKEHPEHTYIEWDLTDKEAEESIDKYHPKPKKLGVVGRMMMGRNYRQIIGLNEPNSEFVICWTVDGSDTGGTGQAIRIAQDKGIPVLNLFNLSLSEIVKEVEKITTLFQ